MPTSLVLSASVVQGTVDPQALVIDVIPSDKIPDLSVITAADLEVHSPDGTTATWTCTITSKTALLLVLTHPYIASDTARLVSFRILARVTIPAGVVRARTCILAVVKP